jgi:acetylornithine deacetylase/succinyl-diaminopimelate desuccinylase-like protein
MNLIDNLIQRPEVSAVCASFHDDLETILDQVVAIQQIPAPTFAEERRARYVEQRFQALGLADVRRDELNNVYGRAPGSDPRRMPLVLSAHLDTVFPAGTDLTTRREGALYYGPGIGDNSAGVAGLLVVAGALRAHNIGHAADIHFVANVGEEGLGDLRGMRAVVDRFGGAATYVVVEGGLYGQLTHQAIGVRRYRVEVTAPGGHSWGSFGAPSAIHVLGRLIAAIDGLAVPQEPKTTYNVGIIEGGLSINTIAAAARLWLDLRSESPDALARLVDDVHATVENLRGYYAGRGDAVGIELVEVGNRPAGSIPRRSPLVVAADAALRAVGCAEARYIVSSTDANIPLSRGYPAVCLGLTHSANCHRTDEYIDVTQLPAGLGQLLLVTLAVAG